MKYIGFIILFSFFNMGSVFAGKDKDCHCGKTLPQEENASGESK